MIAIKTKISTCARNPMRGQSRKMPLLTLPGSIPALSHSVYD
ncbi:hypothetical protein [Azospirillum thermophilum]|nr:hypothetical protein [Azospirillum thermophilum]